MSKRRPPLRYRNFEPSPWQQLLPLFFVIFLDSLGYFLVIPVLLRLFIHPEMAIVPTTTTMTTRDSLYAITLALSPLGFLISAPFIGHISDKLGRKKVLIYCLLGSLVGYLLPILGIYKRAISLILLGRLIAGIASSTQPVAQAAITDFTSGKRKAFFLSMIAFAMTLAMVLGPLIGSYVSDPHIFRGFNLATPYWFGALLASLNILLLYLWFSDLTQVKIRPSRLPFTYRWMQLLRMFKRYQLFLLMFVFLLLELAWSQYYQAIFLFLTQHFHYSTNMVSLFTAYIGLWMSLGLTVIYRILIRYFTIEKILLWSLIIASLGLLGTSYTSLALMQWIFIIPAAICTGTAYPSLLAILSNRTPANHQGWVLGTASLVLGLAWLVTGTISGKLIQIWLPLALWIATLLMFCAFAIYLYAYFKKRN